MYQSNGTSALSQNNEPHPVRYEQSLPNNGHQQIFNFPTNQITAKSKTNQDVQIQPNIVVQIPMHSTSQSSQSAAHQQTRHLLAIPSTRASSSSEIIKSEPIKFEQEPSFSRASPSTATTSSPVLANAHIPKINTSTLVTARPKNASIKCLRCPHCPFISIYQSALNEHLLSQHQKGDSLVVVPPRKKLPCPGCDNVFYSRMSLQTHLANDHQMLEVDIRLLLQSVFEGSLENDSASSTTVHQHPTTTNKQKIYLKNVEVLINPVRSFHTPSDLESPANPDNSFDQRTEQDAYNQFEFEPEQHLAVEDYQDGSDPSDFIDLIDDEYDESGYADDIYASISEIPNKMFVKDNMMLKNPIQYIDPTSQQFPNQTNNGNNLELLEQPINVIETPPPESIVRAANSVQIQNRGNEQIYLQNFADTSSVFEQIHQQPPQPTRKPCKIFIKNVDILKKPMFVQSSGSNSMSPQPTLISSLPGTANPFIDLPFTLTTNTGLSQLLNNTSNTILPHTNHHHKKIFIKNIDILKEPSTFPITPTFIPSPTLLTPKHPEPEIRRNTLHLRTVDELNLMNFNVVQNLIENFQEDPPVPSKHQTVPHYSENQFNCMPDYAPQNENCLDTMLQDLEDYRSEPDKFPYPIQMIQTPRHHQDLDTLQPSISNNFPYNSKLHSIESIHITSANNSTNKEEPNIWAKWQEANSDFQNPFPNLETPNAVDDLADMNKNIDDDLLYDCAQEIINCDEQTLVEELYAVTSDQEATPTESILQYSVPPESGSSDAPLVIQNKLTPLETCNGTSPTTDPYSKGRIYVVNNLMKTTQDNDPLCTTIGSPSPVLVDESNDEGTDADGNDDTDDIEVDVNSIETPSINPIGVTNGIMEKRSTGRKQIASKDYHRCLLDCAMKFRNRDLLTYHTLCHGQPSNQIVCPECKDFSTSVTGFRTWNNLHTHLWRVHTIDMELYTCPECPYKTPSYSRLVNTHALTHSTERNFKCDECQKTFKNSRQLNTHSITHKTYNPTHRCPHCDQLFDKARPLSQHIRVVHKAVEQFQCGICHVTCSSLDARRTHMANHEKDKAKFHQCPECKYSTNDMNAFRRHRLTHGDKQPSYRCPVCELGFTQSTSYGRHILKEHPDVSNEHVFACNSCKFITINRRKYELHTINHISGNVRQPKHPKATSPGWNASNNSCGTPDPAMNVEVVMSTAAGLHLYETIPDGNADLTPNRIKVRSGLVGGR